MTLRSLNHMYAIGNSLDPWKVRPRRAAATMRVFTPDSDYQERVAKSDLARLLEANNSSDTRPKKPIVNYYYM